MEQRYAHTSGTFDARISLHFAKLFNHLLRVIVRAEWTQNLPQTKPAFNNLISVPPPFNKCSGHSHVSFKSRTWWWTRTRERCLTSAIRVTPTMSIKSSTRSSEKFNRTGVFFFASRDVRNSESFDWTGYPNIPDRRKNLPAKSSVIEIAFWIRCELKRYFISNNERGKEKHDRRNPSDKKYLTPRWTNYLQSIRPQRRTELSTLRLDILS